MNKRIVSELRAIVEYLQEINADHLQQKTFTTAAEIIERIDIENEQLRQALRMCDPKVPCKFCGANPYFDGEDGKPETHAEECEYVRLCGGDRNE